MKTTKQAAEFLKVSVRRVQALIKAGRLPTVRHGSAHVIQQADLESLVRFRVGRPSKPTAAP